MSDRVTPLAITIWEEESLCVMARLRLVTGNYVTQAALASITCNVYDGGTTVTSPTVVVADAISDTLVTNDARWTPDTTGYNFVVVLAGTTCFPTGGKRYRVEFTLTTTTGHVSYVVCVVTTLDVLSR